MKFWKWLIEIKIKRLDVKDRIAYLANKMLNELQSNGYKLKSTSQISGFDVNVYNSGAGSIQNILGRWEIEFTPEIEIKE